MGEQHVEFTPGAPEPLLATAERPSRAKRAVDCLLRVAGLTLLGAVLSGMTLWAALAIYYSDLSFARPRTLPAILFVITAITVVVFLRPRRYGVAALGLMFGAVLAWFFSRTPSNDRQWAPDVARLAEVDRPGPHVVTIRNVRNFDYRSETVFTPIWEERS